MEIENNEGLRSHRTTRLRRLTHQKLTSRSLPDNPDLLRFARDTRSEEGLIRLGALHPPVERPFTEWSYVLLIFKGTCLIFFLFLERHLNSLLQNVVISLCVVFGIYIQIDKTTLPLEVGMKEFMWIVDTLFQVKMQNWLKKRDFFFLLSSCVCQCSNLVKAISPLSIFYTFIQI